MSEPNNPQTVSKPSAPDSVSSPAPETSPNSNAPAGHSRRGLLKVAAVGAAGAAVGTATPALLNKLAGNPPPKKFKFLTDAEAVLVDAICEQIIPADEDPGARDAGVVNFIDRQLVGPYRRFQDKYRKGLAATQQTAQAMLGRPFEQLSFDDQTRVLQAMDSGKVPPNIWTDPSAQSFFGLVRDHTMQGFYGSPRHGGNKNYVSYKMLGLEYPRVIGRNKA